MSSIWTSYLDQPTKIHFFRAALEIIILYGTEICTLTSEILKKLDEAYARFFRSTMNISWQDHMINIYTETFLKLSDIIKQR